MIMASRGRPEIPVMAAQRDLKESKRYLLGVRIRLEWCPESSYAVANRKAGRKPETAARGSFRVYPSDSFPPSEDYRHQ